MKCKNCESTLRTDFKYCPGCGAKATARRITFRGLFADISERFFNLESTLFKTIGHLTVKPEHVIGSYIEGVRRKYMNPMNYLGVALALSGVVYFVMKHYALEHIDLTVLGSGMTTEASSKIMDFSLEYQAFIFLAYIPAIAIAGILSFNKRQYNLPEHVVSATYSLAHFSLLTFPVSLIILLSIPSFYLNYSLIATLLMLIYTLFVLVRTHRYTRLITLVRGGVYTGLFMIAYFGISIGISLIMLLLGVLSPEDFAPKQV